MRLLVFVLLWRSWSLAADSDNLVDVTGETVKQVEALLAKDPNLPRLTRGEIISLIHEVRNDSDMRDDKSLLVVLPYNGTGSAQLEDLYTKAPVTKLIGEPMTTKRPKRRRKPTRPRPVYVHSTASLPTEQSTASSESYFVGTTPSTPSYHSNIISASFNSEQTKSKPYTENLSLPKPYKEALHDISVSPQADDQLIFVTPPSTTRGTGAPVPHDVANTAEALSPDLRNLLNNIGIIGDRTTEKPIFQLKAMAPDVDVSSYSRFKPLPTGTDVSDDMKSFLKSFGLLEPSRQRKAMRDPPKQQDSLVNEEMLTDDMKEILKNIGLLGRQTKKMHIFNPQIESAKLNQTEHMIKINNVLKKLREISDGNNQNLTQSDLKELLFIESADNDKKTLLEADVDPSLLSADQFQSLDSIKNEVKRQQPNIAVGASASVSASVFNTGDGADSSTDTTESAQTTEAPEEDVTASSAAATDSDVASSDATERTPSLDDLADSFGGETPDVTTKRPNGFYFLLDWNSFLDVGLDERKVSLNFSPKVGDPRNFISVKVP